MTLTCRSCGIPVDVPATEGQIRRWQRGALIQDAMPDIPSSLREMFLSGLCPGCFDDWFAEEE
jgi:hypothetical protein